MPDYLVPLGRTVGFRPTASSRTSRLFPDASRRCAASSREATSTSSTSTSRPAPVIGLGRLLLPRRARRRHLPRLLDQGPSPTTSATLVGARRKFNQLHARIAVSEAAAWTGRRWFGGDYTDHPERRRPRRSPRRPKPEPRRRAARALRRPRRGAQGPAGPAARLRGAGRARSRPADAWSAPTPRRSRATLADPELARPRSTRSARSRTSELWRELATADVLCAPSLSGESFGMVLTEAFAAGTPGDRLARSPATPTSSPTASTASWSRPPTRSALAEELQRLHHEPARRERDGQAAARERRALRLAARRRARSRASTSGRSRCPSPPTRPERGSRAASASLPPTGSPRVPAAAPALASIPSPPRRIAPPARRAAASALGVAGVAGRRADRPRRAAGSASTTSSRASSARTSPGSWSRLALMCVSMFFRAGVLDLDRPLGAAGRAAAPPRLHLGDDDRRADVGDAAGPPRRARPRDGPRPPDRPHARDVPGPARDAGLADGAQHRRAGPARRDHRQLDRPLPLQLRAALPRSPGAAAAARRGGARPDVVRRGGRAASRA